MLNALIAIVILNYQKYQLTIDLIQNIREYLHYTQYKIVVVDNNSSNESVAELEKNQDKLDYVLIKNTRNSGYAAGNNLGSRYAAKFGAQFIWVLNNDVIVNDPFYLEKMLHTFDLNEKIAGVSPRIFEPDRSEVKQHFARMSLSDMTYRRRRWLKEQKNKTATAKEDCEIFILQGCCMLLKSDYFMDVGLFDENTFLYTEEAILAEKFYKKGFLSYCCTETSVIHEHSITIKSCLNLVSLIKIQYNSRNYYLKKYRKFNILKRLIINLCEISITLIRFIIGKC